MLPGLYGSRQFHRESQTGLYGMEVCLMDKEELVELARGKGIYPVEDTSPEQLTEFRRSSGFTNGRSWRSTPTSPSTMATAEG